MCEVHTVNVFDGRQKPETHFSKDAMMNRNVFADLNKIDESLFAVSSLEYFTIEK